MLKKITSILSGNTCKSASAFLMDYIEGRLEPKTADRFESHIKSCPNCTLYLDQYRQTISLVKEIPAPPVPPELEEHTCEFILDAFKVDTNQKP